MTREQMHTEILAVINRKPTIGVHCMSVEAFKTLNPNETIDCLLDYAKDLTVELMHVKQQISMIRRTKVDHDHT